MKSLFSLVFLTLLFGQQLSSETNDIPPYFVFVNRDSVVVRESPNSTKIASFQQDSELRVLASEGDWLFVSGISGGNYVRGWMWAKFLAPYQNEVESAPSHRVDRSSLGFAKSAALIRRAKTEIIEQDLQRYTSACPCPYSIQPNGTQCRGQSAWESPGGKRPRCYPSDVTLIDLDRHFGVQN